MTKRMLVDATHPEETRVVVVSGTKLEEFDFETSTKKQLKGNIYLAKVIRIEPSLQAAFVEYGGNRHGFLAFSEIHPDYYQIPVADREALLAEQERRARLAEESENGERHGGRRRRGRSNGRHRGAPHGAPAEAEAEDALTSDETDRTAEAESFDETAVPAADAHDVRESWFGDEIADTSASIDRKADSDRGQDEPDQAGETGDERRDMAGDVHGADDQAKAEADGPEPEEARGEPEERAHAPAEFSWPTTRSQPYEVGDERPAPDADAGTISGDEQESRNDDAEEAYENRFPEYGREETQDEAGRYEAERPYSSAHDDDGAETGAGQSHDERGGSDEPAGETQATLETVGGEDLGEDDRPRRGPPPRNYKIQEVIKRRQILLVQVVKEERGNKGAALTTYLSLAGRYCVLMPNAGRGGGVSRKITNAADRKRMKEMLAELDVPSGMGVILRTAGLERSKAEIKRDYDYLMRLWDNIREVTLKSTAPALIYEEGNLIKRSIRDLYTKDIDDILIDGDDGYRAAKEFMRQLMPSHAKKVQLYKEPIPLFHRYQVESQLDAMHSPLVQLKSGGYIVINPTEALVAIDVNSGRSTKERNIEETALRTNIEAAEEIARQLRLRDLAGLIVIDFIDMEDQRHQQQVERRLKEAMRSDRARIQIGRISAFGLLELSRQRLRPSLLETSTEICPYCEGTGRIRSTESTTLHVLRAIEEEGIRRRASEIRVSVPTQVALYLLNQKRGALGEIEARYGFRVLVDGEDSLIPPNFKIERLRSRPADWTPPPVSMSSTHYIERPGEEDEIEAAEVEADVDADTAAEAADETATEADDGTGQDDGRRRKRRRRRRRRGDESGELHAGEAPSGDSDAGFRETGAEDAEQPDIEGIDIEVAGSEPMLPANGEGNEDEQQGDGARRRRRRGRRGGRRRRHGEPGTETAEAGGESSGDFFPDQGTPAEFDIENRPMAAAPEAPATMVTEQPVAVGLPADRDIVVASTEELPVSTIPGQLGQGDDQIDELVEPAHEKALEAGRSAPAEPVPALAEQSVEEEPAGPPRRGWWQRLTTR